MNAQVRLAAIAARQDATFHREQAYGAGFTRWMVKHAVDTSQWGRVYDNVFRIAGSTPSWKQGLTAAWLAAGRGAAVTRVAAAPLYELLPQEGFEITVPPSRPVRLRNVRVRRGTIAAVDLQRVGCLTVATPTFTALELCAVLDLDALVDVFDAMFTRRLSSPPWARKRFEAWATPGRAGAGKARAVLSRYTDGTGAPAPGRERRLLKLLAQLGIELVPQYPVRLRDGRTVHADVGLPSVRAVIELQSFRWHGGLKAHAHDVTRIVEYTACGLIPIPLTPWDVEHRPAWVVDRVARSIGLKV